MSMEQNLEVLGLIPARGGSKTIPDKNILPLGGVPLIVYSIAASLEAEKVTRTVVSTDDEDIAHIARESGAEVPFLRPEEFARDDTPDYPVFRHALEWLQAHEGYRPEIVVQLRPTSPFRKVSQINQAVQRLQDQPGADAVRTVCKPFQDPYKMWRITPDGFMKPLLESEYDEPYNMPRQALPDVYWQTGYVDAAWSKTILEKGSMTGEKILPLVIDARDYVDIDSRADWERAEGLLSHGELSMEELGFSVDL